MYTKKIDRNHPGAIVLLLDQSSSMKMPWDNLYDEDERLQMLLSLADDIELIAPNDPRTRSNRLAELANDFIREVVLSSTFNDEVRPYFYIAVFGYGGDDDVESLLDGTSISDPFVVLDKIQAPEIHEQVDESGRLRRKPQWIKPKAWGSTPMFGALELARDALSDWVDEHPESFPPIVFNITDGEPSDIKIDEADEFSRFVSLSDEIREISTEDGGTLLFSALISDTDITSQEYPSISPSDDLASELLFETSSVMPDNLRLNAKSIGLRIDEGGKCFIFKADPESVMGMLNIGTLATQFF
jgi:hypothetical protein